MNHVRSLILEVLETVYLDRDTAEKTVLAYFERVRRETAPEIDELKSRIEKLEKMLVWSYSFTSVDIMNFDDFEQATYSAGGSPLDSIGWGVGVIECRFDCEYPDGDYHLW